MVSRNVHSSKQKTHNDAIARPSDEMVPYSAFHACGKPNCRRSYSSRFRRDAHSGNYRNFAVTLSTVCRGKQTASVGEPGKQHAIWIFFCGLTHELFIFLFFFEHMKLHACCCEQAPARDVYYSKLIENYPLYVRQPQFQVVSSKKKKMMALAWATRWQCESSRHYELCLLTTHRFLFNCFYFI